MEGRAWIVEVTYPQALLGEGQQSFEVVQQLAERYVGKIQESRPSDPRPSSSGQPLPMWTNVFHFFFHNEYATSKYVWEFIRELRKKFAALPGTSELSGE